jgi:hypothetical protein
VLHQMLQGKEPKELELGLTRGSQKRYSGCIIPVIDKNKKEELVKKIIIIWQELTA